MTEWSLDDHDGLRLRAELEVASMRGFRGGEQDLGQRFLLEAGGGDGEGVAAHVDVLEGVVSSRVGGDGAGGGSAGVDEGDLGSGTSAPLASRTVPRMEPKVDCASRGPAVMVSRQQIARNRQVTAWRRRAGKKSCASGYLS